MSFKEGNNVQIKLSNQVIVMKSPDLLWQPISKYLPAELKELWVSALVIDLSFICHSMYILRYIKVLNWTYTKWFCYAFTIESVNIKDPLI